MNYLFLAENKEARQGPAATVTPVLTPAKPGRLRSLFVFYQTTYLFIP